MRGKYEVRDYFLNSDRCLLTKFYIGTPEPVTLKEIETEIRHIGEDRFSSRGQTFTLPSNLADRISGNLSRTKQDEAIKANMVQLKVDKQAAVSLLGLAKPRKYFGKKLKLDKN